MFLSPESPRFSLESGNSNYLEKKIILLPHAALLNVQQALSNQNFNGGNYKKSDYAKKIQQTLVDLGYDIGKSGASTNGVDGDYGNNTKNAVRQLQEDLKKTFPKENIIPDGLFGNTTAFLVLTMIQKEQKTREGVQKERAEIKKRITPSSSEKANTRPYTKALQGLDLTAIENNKNLGKSIVDEIRQGKISEGVGADVFIGDKTQSVYFSGENGIFCKPDMSPRVWNLREPWKTYIIPMKRVEGNLSITNMPTVQPIEVITNRDHSHGRESYAYMEKGGKMRRFNESGNEIYLQGGFNG
ncbi:peptidoglycan-binding protein [Candidatus Peregrinibacteria bacterium]|nr:MAG: peptidoglycan-binding protein [Candidatus Peregrinibacteria bacterium]